MLGKIFGILALVSFFTAMFTGNLPKLGPAILTGAGDTLRLVMVLAGMMCFWGGMMNIAQSSEAMRRVNRASEPLLRRIFPAASGNPKAIAAITANITANIMGVGNAATPVGLQAMREMSENNLAAGTDGGRPAADDMILFVCINCASLQIIPATLLNLRQTAGSADAAGVVTPIWISSAACMAVMLTLYFVFRGVSHRIDRRKLSGGN